MDTVRLGGSGLKVSSVCLGTANFGTAWATGVGEDGARPVIDAYLDGGGNFLDTAIVRDAIDSESTSRDRKKYAVAPCSNARKRKCCGQLPPRRWN